MRNKLVSKPEISDVLIPKDFAVGCRRPTPGNGFLEALCKDNIEVVNDSITKITATGIETADGVNHEIDIIICATGFDVSCRPAYPTIGRHGKDLAKEWEHIPSTYLSITVPDFPNYLSEYLASPSSHIPSLTQQQSSTDPLDRLATEVTSPSPKPLQSTLCKCFGKCPKSAYLRSLRPKTLWMTLQSTDAHFCLALLGHRLVVLGSNKALLMVSR